MGLKDDIFEAFVSNIQPDNPGENFSFGDAGVNKIDTLAEELSAAIVKFIKAQTFTVIKLNASQAGVPVVTPFGPGTTPMITVKVDDKGQGVDNPVGGGKIESMMSEVKLKRAVEV